MEPMILALIMNLIPLSFNEKVEEQSVNRSYQIEYIEGIADWEQHVTTDLYYQSDLPIMIMNKEGGILTNIKLTLKEM